MSVSINAFCKFFFFLLLEPNISISFSRLEAQPRPNRQILCVRGHTYVFIYTAFGVQELFFFLLKYAGELCIIALRKAKITVQNTYTLHTPPGFKLPTTSLNWSGPGPVIYFLEGVNPPPPFFSS